MTLRAFGARSAITRNGFLVCISTTQSIPLHYPRCLRHLLPPLASPLRSARMQRKKGNPPQRPVLYVNKTTISWRHCAGAVERPNPLHGARPMKNRTPWTTKVGRQRVSLAHMYSMTPCWKMRGLELKHTSHDKYHPVIHPMKKPILRYRLVLMEQMEIN
jgi:hypothetical protein